MKELSPIVVFAYNRPGKLENLLNILSGDPLARDSELFIFIDGPKSSADALKVDKVHEVASRAGGFSSVSITRSDHNKGLGTSIVTGVSAVFEKYDRVIVLEDDLAPVSCYLTYMNAALERYRDNPAVFSICGYTNSVKMPKDFQYDAFFCVRSSSCGWGSWRDRWKTVDWDPSLEDIEKFGSAFNRWGGSDCASMLKSWRIGRNQSWAIRFCYSQFRQNKVSLFPVKSLVDISASFDEEATNCHKYSRFKFELFCPDMEQFRFPEKVEIIPSVRRKFLWYHSIPARAISKIMYMIYG